MAVVRFVCAAFLLRQSAAYVAAVVQHTIVIQPTPSTTISANLALYSTAASEAKAAGAQIINFPEFGLGMPTENCSSPEETAGWTYCEPVTAPIGTVLCGNASSALTPVQVNASCMALENNLWVGINTCERSSLGAYNTELVFAPNGSLAAVYRKDHPWFTKCFLVPTPSLITIDARATLGVTLGVMTCYDILFPEPGPQLVKEGVRHIVYSAAIPVVGSAGMAAWTATYRAVLLGSDLQVRHEGRRCASAPRSIRPLSPTLPTQEGESGVFINGTRASPVPPRKAGTSFVIATVPPF